MVSNKGECCLTIVSDTDSLNAADNVGGSGCCFSGRDKERGVFVKTRLSCRDGGVWNRVTRDEWFVKTLTVGERHCSS